MEETKTNYSDTNSEDYFVNLMESIKGAKENLEKVMMDIEGVSLSNLQRSVIFYFYRMNKNHEEVVSEIGGYPDFGKKDVTVGKVYDWRVSALAKIEEETNHSLDDIEFCLRLNGFFESPDNANVLIQGFRKLKLKNM